MDCTGPALWAPFRSGARTATTVGAALQNAIGAANLRPYVPGQDDRGGAPLSNLDLGGPGVSKYRPDNRAA